MKKWLSFCCSLLLPLLTMAQNNNSSELYAAQWRQVDSLMDRGLPQSAAKQITSIYVQAKNKNQTVQMVKAQVYLMRVARQTDEDADSTVMAQVEKEIEVTSFPVKALWQSIGAELYWSYYQNHRWEIVNRTALAGDPGPDFRMWDASAFAARASALYRASLQESAALEKVGIETYDPLLVKGVNSRQYRPTLYDLLAFRALDYFSNDEKDLTRPAYQFRIDDPAAFAPAAEFRKHRFVAQDSASLDWLALTTYQQVIGLHLDDARPDALLDADLHRLEYMYNHYTGPGKKEAYRKALQQIESNYASHPLSALAAYRLVVLINDAEQVAPMEEEPSGEEAKRIDRQYPLIKEKLQAIIRKYPESEGGVAARQLLQSIESQELALQTEEAVLPGEASKILVRYRNVAKAWLRVVPVDPEQFKNNGRYGNDPFVAALLKAKPIQSFAAELPGTADYDQHSTELKIDALQPGVYAVLISSHEGFARENNILSYALFQSTRLSVITQTGRPGIPDGYVLDRKTGKPVGGASYTFYNQRYDNKIPGYIMQAAKSGTTATDGSFRLQQSNESYEGMKVSKDKDAFYSFSYLNFYRYEQQWERKPQTFFFTDRSIYRPGQTIHFKGIMAEGSEEGRKQNVLPGRETEVTLYDANGQKVSSQKLKTNEFGSFSGSFTAPETGLTGQMYISDAYGSVYFSVEEYKRPKFFVAFDTLKASYALNEKVTLKGKATAYAGNAIDGATVQYRVTRRARFPFWWCFWRYGGPTSPTQEISSGSAVTEADGSFTVEFTTIPDPTIDERALPVFTYEVSADVTDINGETRSGSQGVSAGYRALQFSTSIPEQALAGQLDSIRITTRNLNEVFVAADVTISIARLQAPDKVYRKRLWAKPDQYVISEADFRRNFPLDEYRSEANHLTWGKGAATWQKTITTTADGQVRIGREAFNESGWYVIELKAKDKNGKTIEDKKYVQVWNPGKKGNAGMPLMTIADKTTTAPGEKVQVYTASAFDDANVFEQVLLMGTQPKIREAHPGNEALVWNHEVTEGDRGGMALRYVMVKENRVYTAAADIAVPWSNKDLSISWETHRDKLLPGQKETWTMIVKGNKKEKVAAEMVAALYDASLDAFRPHSWSALSLFPNLNSYVHWNTEAGFSVSHGRAIAYLSRGYVEPYQKTYDELITPGERYGRQYYRSRGDMAGGAKMESVAAAAPAPAAVEDLKAPARRAKDQSAKEESAFSNAAPKALEPQIEKDEESGAAKGATSGIAPRTNLQETAFFYPQLRTDAEGNIRIQFTIPEALTEWKLLAFAHTTDMSTGMLEGKVKTQKDLMVVPGLPRFFRQGDDLVLSTKISNLSAKELNGTATLELLDAQTLKPLNLPFRLKDNNVSFKAAAGQSTSASWTIHVPESLYEPVIVRVLARAGDFTDGEENMLPVITNRMLVTETMPLWINGNGTKEFRLDKLLQSGSGGTLAQHAVTVEYTGNPAWYAVQALPYLMEFPYECAEQTFNRYYANALAAHIANSAPRVQEIFRQWEKLDTAALMSNLQKNQELKSALLEETPWVMEAKNEAEQKKRIAMLFEATKLARGLSSTARKLEDMMMSDGAFPWFKGSRYPDRYITQYIVTGIGRLKHLKVGNNEKAIGRITTQAVPYLDRAMKESYDALVKNKAKLEEQQIGYFEVQYLYMRSFFREMPVQEGHQKAYNYYQGQAKKYWPKFNAYMKGMIALALHRGGDAVTPKQILQSLKETAQQKEEMGMYWMQPGNSYWWYEAPIEAQALLIECFDEVAADVKSVDAMRVWLLKQKQTQNWHTTKATADACYALLLSGTQWLTNEPQVTIQLGSEAIISSERKTEAGTGYFKVRYDAAQVKPEMGNVKLTVQGNDRSTSWGAIYWQYFENLDKITGAATPLVVKKQLFIERKGDRGPVLEPITEKNVLKVGDKVKVRLEIIADRDMEYVHLKDMRGSCFEPVNVISAYHWQGGLGYYESTKDVSSNFFIDYLRKGRYVFEYPMFVTHRGDFSNGIATIQCMYAPEFSAHSEGMRVQVK